MKCVKIENGIIIGSAFNLSSNPTDSPNKYWSVEQLKLHNYLPVILPQIDSLREYIDYNNPTITANSVDYNSLNKVSSDILDTLKVNKINYINAKAKDIIYSKYSLEKQLSGSLEAYGIAYKDQMKLDIKTIIDESNALQTQVNNATSEAELDAIVVSFSTI